MAYSEFKITKNDKVSKTEMDKLRKSVNWSPRSNEVGKALKYSHSYYSIRKNGELVGFVRVISDKSIHANIVDLTIRKDCQGRGLGKKLMKRVVSDLKKENFAYIDLSFNPGLEGFYKKSGFRIIKAGIIEVK
jgi:ribosomal protein S18 acetylase RimI-like enzyme